MLVIAYYFISYLIVFVCSDNVEPQNRLESQVLLLLEKWRMGYVNYELVPLPLLTPVYIPQIESSLDKKGIKMTYKINTIKLTGLENFSVEELKTSETKKNLHLLITVNIPKITLYAENYELKGRAYLLYPLKGSGNMTVIVRDSDLTFKIHLGSNQDCTSTRISDFLLDFNVGNIEANLVNSSWPINKVLNKDGVEILASYHDDIVQALWDYIVPYVDEHLVNVTITKIVNMILNISL